MVGINFEDWEQRKLISLGNLNRGKSKHRPRNDPKLYGGEYPFVQTGDVAKAGLFLNSYKQTYSEFGIQQSKLWDKGTLLITIAANIAETSILSIQVAFPDSVIGFESNQVDMVFLKNVIDNASNTLKSKVETSSQANLNLAKLSELNVNVPSLSEQAKIGELFTILENAIALHQDKLEKLKQLKKGYLRLMFPQNEEIMPLLRFANFPLNWEQRKLNELATFSKGLGYTKSDLVEEGTPIILYGRLYTKYQTVIEYVDTFVLMKGKTVLSEGDEVIVPSSGESSEDIARASVVAKAGILLGGDLNIIKTNIKINSIFLALNISNGKQQQELSKKAQGKSVVHLHNSDLKKVDLIYPTLEEQIQIGNFFKQLDDNINLQNAKVEKLKKLKVIYLQKLCI